MKRKYIQPHTEAVVVRCNEKLMWGEMQDGSNTFIYNDSKKGFFDDEEDDDLSNDLWDKDNLWK